jgi:hypothetical protein
MECFVCGNLTPGPRTFSGAYKIVCQNANQPDIMDRAKLNVRNFQTRKKRCTREYKKQKNINTINWDDIPPQQCKVILQQQCSLLSVLTADATTVASSLTGPTCTNNNGTCSSVILHQDAVALIMEPSKPPVPISIYSPLAHVTLQTGSSDKAKDCLGIQCVFDSDDALNTANYHFMEAVICQYPQIVKQIYLLNNYTAIILSGIVSSPTEGPITTK